MSLSHFDGRLPPPLVPFCPESPVGRWVMITSAVVYASTDTPNLRQWAKRVHVSRSTLCNRCHAAGAPAKASLTLARLVRTLIARDSAWFPEAEMDIVDPRTLAGIMMTAGVPDYQSGRRPTLETILIGSAWPIPLDARLALGAWVRRTSPAI
jgi:hypothetical protein